MAVSIRKGLLQFVFSGSYMKRWNDKLRLIELIEIDKQAHKMIIAWLLCQLRARGMAPAERLKLERSVVEGGIFDYLFRLVITDIKPPILYRIKDNPEQYNELAGWALKELEPHILPLGKDLWERLQAHVLAPGSTGPGADILSGAHIFASAWEFKLIKEFNAPFDEEMAEIDRKFHQQLLDHSHLEGMSDLLPSFERWGMPKDGRCHLPALASFANLCGQLRFQKRWSQTPRTPETSVMGHMFLVAVYAYFLSLALEACPARQVNNFFCGLFHDLPEMLTRDIISPVKKSSETLNSLIREYEEKELERRVFAPLKQAGYEDLALRLGYYLGLATGSEFHNTVLRNGDTIRVESFTKFHTDFNHDSLDPKDGEAIKECDILAAYIEAYTAMRNGITSDHIQQAFWRMRENQAKKMLGPFHIGALFTDFD